MRPKASTAAAHGGGRLIAVGDVERDGAGAVGMALDQVAQGIRVASGGDDLVAGGQRGVGELATEAAGTAGDEPCLGH